MVTINIKSDSGEEETVKKFLLSGLLEERKRIEYALNITIDTIKKFEEQFGISTASFLEKFKRGEIKENDEYFRWWAESKVADELTKNLDTIKMIKI